MYIHTKVMAMLTHLVCSGCLDACIRQAISSIPVLLQKSQQNLASCIDGIGFAIAGEKGSLWSFNFFFYNKKLKKIAYFSCRAISKSVAQEDSRQSSGRYASYTSAVENSDEGDSRYGMAGSMEV